MLYRDKNNIYRSDSEGGEYIKINPYFITADEETFLDDTVESCKVYYYNFTVVQTDLQESAPSGKLIIMSQDAIPPVITHTPLSAAYTDSNAIISAYVQDNMTVASVTLYYRGIGETEWHKVTMTGYNGRYTGMIPANNISGYGMEYYIDAFDGVSHSYEGTVKEPIRVDVTVVINPTSRGDLDNDGVITVSDALIALRISAGLQESTPYLKALGDIDGDKSITVADALMILRAAVGLIESI